MDIRIGSGFTFPMTTPKNSTNKSALDELSRLSGKFKGYSFFAADIKYGMTYGSKNTTNVAISPQFLKKMANDPKLAEEYEKEIANMKECDKWCRANMQARGDKLVADGWAIDKDGGISRWSIGNPGGNTRVKSPTEYANELYEKRKEKGKTALKHRTNTTISKPSIRFDRKV